MSVKNRLRPLVATLALIGCFESGLSQSALAADFPRIALSSSLSWISSAVWVPELKRVAVIDPLRNQLLLVSREGEVSGVTPPSIPGEESFLPAAIVKTRDDRFLLSLVGSRLVPLGPQLQLTEQAFDFRATSNGKLGSLYDWVVAGASLVGYGSVRDASGHSKFSRGFLVAPLSDLSDARILLSKADSKYYRIGNSYFATVGSDVYILVMDPQPYIVEVSSRGAIRRVGTQLATISDISTQIIGPQSDEALYLELEKKMIPVGIYGFRGSLFLLERGTARNKWIMSRIDPRTGAILGSDEITSTAKHVSIVVADDGFFLFERGRVDSTGAQKISSMLKLPGIWLESIGRREN